MVAIHTYQMGYIEMAHLLSLRTEFEVSASAGAWTAMAGIKRLTGS